MRASTMHTAWIGAMFVAAGATRMTGTAGAEEPVLRHVDVFVSGTQGYHTFRIPGIEVAPDGTVLAFAEARKHSAVDPGFGKQDIDLVLRRSTDGGTTWSPMQVIEDPGELWSAANPATAVDRETGRVWLIYLRCRPERNTDTARPGTDDNQTLARWSGDGGKSWSEPVDLTAVARDMADPKWKSSVVGPGGAIQDRKGRLVAPVWMVEPPQVFAIFSEDHGKTWQRGARVPGGQGGDEDQIVELPDGTLLLDYRQRSGDHRWMATSSDGGRTWSEPRPGLEVTPVCCAIERYPLAGGGEAIIWTGPKGPERSKLVLRVSRDGAKTFPVEREIYPSHAAYSDLAVLKDGDAAVLWERGEKQGYESIAFTRLPRKFIEAP